MNDTKPKADEIVKEIDITEVPSLDDFMKELSTVSLDNIEFGDDFSETSADNYAFDGEVVHGFEDFNAPVEPPQSSPSTAQTSAKLRLEAEILQLRNDHSRLQHSYSELTGAYARSSADFDSFKKRVERERGEHYQFAVTHIVNQLLPVLDNFERALANAESNCSVPETLNFIGGVELIYQQLKDVLERMGVKRIESVGEFFDPAHHEAVATQPCSEQHPPNSVIEEVRSGYKLGNRLIRAAMVKVATA